MTWQWLALAAVALVALALCGILAVALARLRAESAGLRDRLDQLEQQRRTPPAAPAPAIRAEDREYTITGLGEAPADAPEPAQLERAVFADLLLRESVIRIGSLSHGVRRALSAESRNRIRFQMRQEVKRARKQRRVEQREAYREWQQRQRDSQRDSQRDVA